MVLTSSSKPERHSTSKNFLNFLNFLKILSLQGLTAPGALHCNVHLAIGLGVFKNDINCKCLLISSCFNLIFSLRNWNAETDCVFQSFSVQPTRVNLNFKYEYLNLEPCQSSISDTIPDISI
jgi:hypothetical protein